MKKLSLVVALIALAIPAVTSAKGGAGHKSAAKQCKAMRADMGADAFRAAFAKKGGKAPMKRCIAAQRKAHKAAQRRARKACRAEGKRGRALKRCVRGKLQADPPTAAAPDAYKEWAQECRDARAEDPEAFTDEYGDGPDALEQCIADMADTSDEITDDDDLVDQEPGDEEPVEDPGTEPDPDAVP
jgi:hypothetical protein